ncbi:MAG: signal peptidase I [Trueperaceae bacterium]|nr:MAG: signal peptidase I [Trueperaceae bacterium]
MANTRASRKGSVIEKKKTFSERFWAEVRGYAEALVIAFLIVTFVFNTVGVVGSSMRPNLDGGIGSQNLLQSLFTGDRVFIPKYDTWLRRAGILGPYRRGEVIVVREPGNAPSAQERTRRPFFIKRLIGVPGDRVRIESGQVVINGHPLDQTFISGTGEIVPDPIDFPLITTKEGTVDGMVVHFASTLQGTPIPQLPYHDYPLPSLSTDHDSIQLYYGETLSALAPLPPDTIDGIPFVHDIVVPKGHYFIMGDNRQSAKGGSEDSRYFGPIPMMTVAGRATAVIWPPRRNGSWNWRRITPPEAFEEIPPQHTPQ